MLDKLKKVVIALGYFDSVHIGHQRVIKKAQNLAKELGVEMAIFTFSGNLRKAVGKSQDKCVYTLDERTVILNKLGVENIYYAPCTADFLAKSKWEFLQDLNQKYQIVGYVCGRDYKFGRFCEGNVEFLNEIAQNNNQQVAIVEDILDDGKRISSTEIKSYLSEGNIEKVNKLLDRSFSVRGEVVKDRGVGKSIGFPTANLKIDQEKAIPKNAVYYGHCIVYGKEYKCIINCGIRPTFDVYKDALEVHLIGFEGNLYDTTLEVYFDGFIREIKKFSNLQQLKDQLDLDKQYALKG